MSKPIPRWGVWCEAINREAWLRRDNGAYAVFSKREQAEAEAKRLTATIGTEEHRNLDVFAYTARPFS
jgi:hypothetical protein